MRIDKFGGTDDVNTKESGEGKDGKTVRITKSRGTTNKESSRAS